MLEAIGILAAIDLSILGQWAALIGAIRSWYRRIWFAIAMAVLAFGMIGCAPANSDPQTFILSRNIRVAASEWRGEVSAHLHDPVAIVVCHGAELDGQWTLCPDDPDLWMPVRQFCKTFQLIHPGEPLFLVVCNPAGDKLDLPGVYYARSSVWVRPGTDDRFYWRTLSYVHFAGSFNDFVQDK
jgi:hypothetical protein